MCATEEQMALIATAHVTHVSYILILYSISFLLLLFVCMLLHLYAVHALPQAPKPEPAFQDEILNNGPANRALRDAEEFELEGLMSEDEDMEGAGKRANGTAR